MRALYNILAASSMRCSIKNAHSAVWSARWGDLLFELLADLGFNKVIVHDADEVLFGGPDYTGLNIFVLASHGPRPELLHGAFLWPA